MPLNPIINVNSFNIRTDSLRMRRMTLNNRDNSKSIINNMGEEGGERAGGKGKVQGSAKNYVVTYK